MSDSMLHGILQMPPELWTNDAIDIAQRHGRYLEASKRIIELERQLDWALKSREAVWNSWNKALEERDEARSERNAAREELKRLKKELVSANRGAETNAKINQSLAKKLHDLEGYAAMNRDHLQACITMHLETMNERDEARRELAELKTELARVSQMNQHADKSSVGDSTYVLTQQQCQRASRVRNC